MSRRFLLVPFLFAYAGAIFAQTAPAPAPETSLTLDQAVALALTNQPLIEQALAAVEAARDRVGEAQSAYYPNVSAGAPTTGSSPARPSALRLSCLRRAASLPRRRRCWRRFCPFSRQPRASPFSRRTIGTSMSV